MTTPAERLRSSIAANEGWARCEDRSARTLPGRLAAEARFEKLVDPEGKLPPRERAIRAEYARKAHFKRMALKSAEVRKRRALRRLFTDN
jgi:hypothetical protein